MDVYLIWSNEHNAWWRPTRNGYTTVIANAGRYDFDDAIEICSTRSLMNYGLPPELPIEERAALALIGKIPGWGGTGQPE